MCCSQFTGDEDALCCPWVKDEAATNLNKFSFPRYTEMNVDYLNKTGRTASSLQEGACQVCPIRSATIAGGAIYYRFLLPLKSSLQEEHERDPSIPLLVLTGPGQSGMNAIYSFAVALMKVLAPQVKIHMLIWDRRNIGLSDINYEFSSGQNLVEEEADDLFKLLTELNRLDNLFLLGMSSGARLTCAFHNRHQGICRGIILAPPTGGKTNNAIEILCEAYYQPYIRAAEKGGMQAVLALPFYSKKSDRNKARLLATDVDMFSKALQDTCSYFRRFKDAPLIGLTESEMRMFDVPVLVSHSGDTKDKLHLLADARIAANMLPKSESLVVAKGIPQLLPSLVSFLRKHAGMLRSKV